MISAPSVDFLFPVARESLVVSSSSVTRALLARYLSKEGLIVAGFACYAIGFGAAWVILGLFTMTGAVVIIDIGVDLLTSVVDAAVGDRVAPQHLAGAMPLRNSTTFHGGTADAIMLAGLPISVGSGYESLLLVSCLAAIAATGIIMVA
jgi:MFS transporter, ACDE family, multidrug resistance protein